MWVEQILKMESFFVGAASDSRGRHSNTPHFPQSPTPPPPPPHVPFPPWDVRRDLTSATNKLMAVVPRRRSTETLVRCLVASCSSQSHAQLKVRLLCVYPPALRPVISFSPV